MTAVISTDIDLPVPVTQSFKPNFSLDVVIRIDRDRSLTLMSSLDDDDTRIKTTCFTALALKIVLNTISTYAQSQGRYAIEGNVTIGVTAANDKIYDRCLRIIKSRGGTERTLLRAVYRVDDVEELLRRPRVEHIKAATRMSCTLIIISCTLIICFVFFSFQPRSIILIVHSSQYNQHHSKAR